MKQINNYRLLIILLSCIYTSSIIFAEIAQEDVCISLSFAQTVLLEIGEPYHKGIGNDPDFKRRSCRYTMVDSSCTIRDTLYGKGWYLLYFDTTSLADGIELQRTKDSLCLLYDLNREIDSYRSGGFLTAPREIFVADSLVKNELQTKHIWMDRYSPYYAPYHSLIVNFTIIPLSSCCNQPSQ